MLHGFPEPEREHSGEGDLVGLRAFPVGNQHTRARPATVVLGSLEVASTARHPTDFGVSVLAYQTKDSGLLPESLEARRSCKSGLVADTAPEEKQHGRRTRVARKLTTFRNV